MRTEVVMPALEMAQDTGKLIQWLKAEGEFVRKGEPLMEIETDKVTVEIEAAASGYLTQITAHPGDEVPVGRVIALLFSDKEAASSVSNESPPTPATASPVARRMAKEHSIDLLKVSTSKPRIEKADVLAYLHHSQTVQSTQPNEKRPLLASPKARRLAIQNGIELTSVVGSGPNGAVVAADVQTAQILSSNTSNEYQIRPMTSMRRTIAARLQASYHAAPHIALSLSVDMTEILSRIDNLQPEVQAQIDHALTLTSVLGKFVSTALLKHPQLNAHFVDGEIREFAAIHLGIAVALEDGLIVPVIPSIEQKGLASIQGELSDLVARARAGKLIAQEIKGSTFTISNLGMFGVEYFTALLNPPEVGILSVGTIKDEAVGRNGQIALRPMMTITANVDHRVIDGAVAAVFLKTLKNMLENPSLIML